MRKGSQHMEYLLKKGVVEKITAFGVIDQVIPEGVVHKGIVECPSSFYRPGDIYLSFSSLEGLQRSVIEALISGCFVICLERPDSIFLDGSPLVFVVDNIDSVDSCLHLINLITAEQYSQMYSKNYDFLVNNFSHETVRLKWLELI
jgi:glycosyltransferase involved in cell wall biosynthesis